MLTSQSSSSFFRASGRSTMEENQAQVMILLLEELNRLTEEQFTSFKWQLGRRMRDIPAYKLERADRHETVDLMVQHHPHQAVVFTTDIFRAIARNDLAEHLTQQLADINMGDLR